MESQAAPIQYILVVSFHHQLGNHVEFAYPPLPTTNATASPSSSPRNTELEAEEPRVRLPSSWEHIPFLAMPDGCHQFDEDYTYFILPSLSPHYRNVYGISCFRQIGSDEVRNLASSYTRSHVQKSVCAISILPYFGIILTRLTAATRAYFDQRDFSRTEILREIYEGLNASFSSALTPSASLTASSATYEDVVEAQLCVGLSLRRLAKIFGRNLLVLFKLLLLERRVTIFSMPAGTAASGVLSLVSLMPGLLAAGMPAGIGGRMATDERMKHAALFALPLRVFASNHALFPYAALQQLDMLAQYRGFLAGISNLLFLRHRAFPLDVAVDMTTGQLDIRDSQLAKHVLVLTASDRHFIDEIIAAVASVDDVDAEMTATWHGSDEWIRRRFDVYIECFLASVAAALPGLFEESGFELSGGDTASPLLAEFNPAFVAAWLNTDNAAVWRREVIPQAAVRTAAEAAADGGAGLGHPTPRKEFHLASVVADLPHVVTAAAPVVKRGLGRAVDATSQLVSSVRELGLGTIMGGGEQEEKEELIRRDGVPIPRGTPKKSTPSVQADDAPPRGMVMLADSPRISTTPLSETEEGGGGPNAALPSMSPGRTAFEASKKFASRVWGWFSPVKEPQSNKD